jgi:hypothetical protein
MTKLNDDSGESKVVIGELTSVRIGLIIAFLGVFASAIWWASSISSKLDNLLSLQATTTTSISQLNSEISDLKLKEGINESDIKGIKDKITLTK